MRTRLLHTLVVAGAAIALMLSPSLSHAVSINFDQNSISGGTLLYDGAGGPLVGTGIIFDLITGIDTPLHAAGTGSDLTCVGCTLAFTTGANVQETPVYAWAGGGSFVLTGTAQDPGGTVVASGTLLSGVWGSFVSGASNGVTINTGGQGTDTKNADLVAYFGITGANFTFASTQFSSSSLTLDPSTGAFSGVVDEADLDNRTGAAAIPEPASLFLFGSGLIGLSWLRRKRHR